MNSIFLPSSSNGEAKWLKRTSFGGETGTRNETWLQDILFRHSDLIPIKDIALGTAGFVPICRELTIPKGGASVYLDIFGLTPEGRPVLVECKLWRNPQARREVIAQILEYAALVRLWSYGDLTARVNAKLKTSEVNPLFSLVAEQFPEIDEARFVDGVSQSLRTGDFILIIAGDGIRSDVHAIADYLNQPTGTNSRLALVEFQLWQNDAGDTTIIPFVPVKTELIQQRIIVDASGAPVTTVSATSSEDEESAMIDPDREVGKQAEKAFWQAFIDSVHFDHPDQPVPRHGSHGWVKLPLPDPIGWMTAYRSKNGTGGLFIRFKGEEGKGTFAAFEEVKAQLETELGHPVVLEVKRDDPFEALMSITFDGDAKDDVPFMHWLKAMANKSVSTLRPFINQMA